MRAHSMWWSASCAEILGLFAGSFEALAYRARFLTGNRRVWHALFALENRALLIFARFGLKG